MCAECDRIFGNDPETSKTSKTSKTSETKFTAKDFKNSKEWQAYQEATTNAPGRRRPTCPLDGKQAPVPYVGGKFPSLGSWARIDDARAEQIEEDLLCVMCGKPRGTNWLYAAINGQGFDHRTADPFMRIFGGGVPSATFGHPNCIYQASLYCPFLKKSDYPALTQAKRPISRKELGRLAAQERSTAAYQAEMHAESKAKQS